MVNVVERTAIRLALREYMYYVESTLGDHPAPPISVIREIKSIGDLLRVERASPQIWSVEPWTSMWSALKFVLDRRIERERG